MTHDVSGCFGTPGKCDSRDKRVRCQYRSAFRPKASDDIDNTGRKASLIDQFGKFKQRGWAVFRGFQYDSTSGGKRRPQFYRAQKQLAVPGDDGSDHSNRFPFEPDFHIGPVNRKMRTFHFVGKSRIVPIKIGNITDLRRRFPNDFSGVSGFQLGDILCMLFNQVSQAVQQLTAFRCIQICPSRISKGTHSRLNSVVYVIGTRLGHQGPRFTVGRVYAFKCRAAIFEYAVDVLLKLVHCASPCSSADRLFILREICRFVCREHERRQELGSTVSSKFLSQMRVLRCL